MDVIFIRNGPVILSYTKIAEVEKKVIANELSDVNLAFARNFDYENSVLLSPSVMLFIHLFEKLNRKDLLDIVGTICDDNLAFDYDIFYSGTPVSYILFNYNFQKGSNIILCEKTSIHKKMKLNKRKLLIELDSEKDMQLIEKLVNPKLTEEINKSNNVVDTEIFEYKGVLTPLNLKYSDKEYTIGFVYSSRKYACNILILCFRRDILKNREIFVKLFAHLIHLFVLAGRMASDFLKETDGNCVYLNFKNRKYNILKGEKIETEIENLEDVFNNITMGFEGEFCFLSKDADNSYRTVEAKKVITDYLMFMNRYEETGRLLTNYIGVDGARSIGEIRTKAYKIEENAYEKLVKEIENILSEVKLCAKLSDCEVTFSSEKYPTGVHFHLGFHDFTRFNNEEKNIIARNFILLLDVVLSSFLEVLNTDVRLETSYSNKMNFRIKLHGFEYRTPPSVIFYYDLYKHILKFLQQIAVDYFKNKCVTVEMDNINVPSMEFYRKYMGENLEEFSEKVCKLRDLVNKSYLLAVDKTDVYVYEYKTERFFDEIIFNDAELQNVLIELNMNYAKNSIVKITTLDEFAADVKNCEFEVNMSLLCKYFPSANPILRDYCIYVIKVGEDFKKMSEEEKKSYFEKILYNTLKEMEQRSNLKGSADEIIEKLMRSREVFK